MTSIRKQASAVAVLFAITSLPLIAAAQTETNFNTQLNGLSLASVRAMDVAALPAVAAPKAAAEQPADLNRGGDADTPNWSVTPGNLCTPSDPNFKEYRYPEHIAYCNRNVTKDMKLQVAAEYNVPQSDWSKYEFDHLIPLCIGGDSSVDNLWPEPRGNNGGSDEKDKLENDLYKQMAAGTITQKAAVQQIYDWFKRYAGRHPELPAAVKAKIARMA